MRIASAARAVVYGRAMPNGDAETGEPEERAGADAVRAAIGRHLRRARMMIDDNRARIAEEFGVTGMGWQKWEEGLRYPSVPVMLAFCARYGFTMEFLYTGRLDSMPERFRRKFYKMYPQLLDAPDETPVPAPKRKRPDAGAAGRNPERPPDEMPDTPATGRRRAKRRRGAPDRRP